MCNFFSALGFRDGSIKHHWALDSHSDLIAYFNLDDTKDHQSQFVKLELVPADKTWLEPDKWTFSVDEPTSPIWCDDATQTQFRNAMVAAAKRMIVREKRRLICDGCWILADGAIVSEAKAGRVISIRGGTVDAIWGGTVNEIRGGTVNEIRGGTVNEIWGGTVNEIRGGTVDAIWGGTVNVIRGGAVNEIHGGKVNAIWGGTVDAICGGTVNEIHGGTVNEIHGGTVNAIHGGTVKKDYRR